MALKRTFLREETGKKTIQIQAIGLSLYEPIEGTTAEQIGSEVIRTQWLWDQSDTIILGFHCHLCLAVQIPERCCLANESLLL